MSDSQAPKSGKLLKAVCKIIFNLEVYSQKKKLSGLIARQVTEKFVFHQN